MAVGVLTLFARDWIELIFEVDPGRDFGWMDRLIVAILLIASIPLGSVACWEWRRGVRQASGEAAP